MRKNPWPVPLDEWDLSDIEDMEDALDIVISARRVARNHYIDEMDEIELSNALLDLMAEGDRRAKLDGEAARREYERDVMMI